MGGRANTTLIRIYIEDKLELERLFAGTSMADAIHQLLEVYKKHKETVELYDLMKRLYELLSSFINKNANQQVTSTNTSKDAKQDNKTNNINNEVKHEGNNKELTYEDVRDKVKEILETDEDIKFIVKDLNSPLYDDDYKLADAIRRLANLISTKYNLDKCKVELVLSQLFQR